ncbi:uncharacterized protein LOC132331946 [Haemorhous mexicanus]|uniref:uncharacterized protein LOC132331946 n=1 Tax=Haemorhous mexicanus TaxID=30427 RepID=UPI0028BD7E65|nr:uncharacterized protein LOC132331946 [Haemorhous mexicanus]
MAPRGAGGSPAGLSSGHRTQPCLPSPEKRGAVPAPAEWRSRVWELAAGLRSCCPGSTLMAEFLSKKTDWEREHCSMHLLVTQKAQTRHGGTRRQQGRTLGDQPLTLVGNWHARLDSGLSPGLNHCPGQGIPGALGWAWHPSPGRVLGPELPQQQHPPAPACPGDTGTASKGPVTGTGGSAASLGKVPGTARPQGAPSKENDLDKPRERAAQTQVCISQQRHTSSEQRGGVLENRQEATDTGNHELRSWSQQQLAELGAEVIRALPQAPVPPSLKARVLPQLIRLSLLLPWLSLSGPGQRGATFPRGGRDSEVPQPQLPEPLWQQLLLVALLGTRAAESSLR